MLIASYIIGGIGIFLLGMLFMTEGLKALAGEKLKNIIKRFVSGKLSSIFSGFVVTAIVQSSTVTTLMTIGFVGAGLITFTQSIGLILGSNIGSTTTAWIVSVLGIKFKIMSIALPFIALGTFLRLSKYEKYQFIGNSLAGFGLIFVGIDILQEGMGSLSQFINLQSFGQGPFGSILLLIVGILMTVIMQSSGATVAMTITALATGTIGFNQAIILVIGQNIGTTSTALIGSIGATVPAKRAALAHVFFNLIVGIIVFITLPLFIQMVYIIGTFFGIYEPSILLSIFHTGFNLFGIIIFFPFINLFAKIIEKIAPEKENGLTRRLGSNKVLYPELALEALWKTIIDILVALNEQLSNELFNNQKRDCKKIEEIEVAIKRVEEFFNQISGSSSNIKHETYLSLVHATTHLRKIFYSFKHFNNEDFTNSEFKSNMHQELNTALNSIQFMLQNNRNNISVDQIEKISSHIKQMRIKERSKIIQKIANREITTEEGMKEIDDILWLDSTMYYLWRIISHLTTFNK